MDDNHDKIVLRNKHYFMLLSHVNTFRQTPKFCDVKLLVDGDEYPAHKVILAAFSPYFDAMFSGQFPEASQPEVSLNSIDSSIIRTILNYIYTGSIEITINNVQELLHAAHFFQAIPLFETCCLFLEQNMTEANCLNVYHLAEVYSCPTLKEKAKDYTVIHFPTVSQGKEFLELDADTVITFISNDSLNVKNEEVVFEAIMRWVYFKENERTPVITKVFTHVRLALLNPNFLHDRVETEEIIKKSPSLLRLVEEAKWYNLLLTSRIELQSSLTRQRRISSDVKVLLVHGLCQKSGTEKLLCMTDDGLVIKEILPPPVNVEYFVSDYEIMAVSKEWCDKVWYFDVKLNYWKQTSPMIKSRLAFTLLQLGSYWYAFGGVSSKRGIIDTVERYDPARDVWILMEPLPKSVSSPAVTCFNGNIYICGGYGRNLTGSDAILQYDPLTSSWTQIYDSPAFREINVCELNGSIYTSAPNFLGFSSLETFVPMNNWEFHKYNITANRWKQCANISSRIISGPVSFSGNVFALTETSKGSRVLLRYLPSSDSWRIFADFPNFRPQFISGSFLISRPSGNIYSVLRGSWSVVSDFAISNSSNADIFEPVKDPTARPAAYLYILFGTSKSLVRLIKMCFVATPEATLIEHTMLRELPVAPTKQENKSHERQEKRHSPSFVLL